MSENKKTTVLYEPEPPRGPLNNWGVYVLSLGTVLGAGLITMLPAGITAGGARMGVIFPFMILLAFAYVGPYIAMASCVRAGGGTISYVGACAKPIVAGIMSIATLITSIGVGTFGISLASYVNASVGGYGNLVACGVIILFFIFHSMGADILGKVQKIMMPVLIVGLLLFIGFGIPHIDKSLLSAETNPSWALNGTNGVFLGWLAMYGCTVSTYLMVFQGRPCQDARKQIPRSMIATMFTLIPLYAGFGIVAAGVLPADQLNNTLVSVVYAIFPNWLATLWVLLVPMLLIATTINGMLLSYTMTWDQVARDGWIPKFFAKTNKRGVPIASLAVCTILPLIPILTGYNIINLLGTTNIVTYLGEVAMYVALFSFPKKYPNAWKNSTLRFPTWLFYTSLCTAIIFKSVVVYSSFLSLDLPKLITTIAIILVLTVWAFIRNKSGAAQIRVSLWDGTGKDLS